MYERIQDIDKELHRRLLLTVRIKNVWKHVEMEEELHKGLLLIFLLESVMKQ
jgi:hypothetical protein